MNVLFYEGASVSIKFTILIRDALPLFGVRGASSERWSILLHGAVCNNRTICCPSINSSIKN